MSFVVEWLFMVIIPFLPKENFSCFWWCNTTVINCVHSLVFTVHGTFFFYSTVTQSQLVTRVDVILLSYPFYILVIFCIQLWLTFTVKIVLLKILCSLCSLWAFGKCLLINRRKIFAAFVDTTLLNGGLNKIIFREC